MPRPSVVILLALAFALPARAQLDASQMAAAAEKSAALLRLSRPGRHSTES